MASGEPDSVVEADVLAGELFECQEEEEETSARMKREETKEVEEDLKLEVDRAYPPARARRQAPESDYYDLGTSISDETTTSPTAAEGCRIDEETNYSGADIAGKSNIPVEDRLECASLCFDFEACKVWTFDTAKKFCYLKTSDEGKGRDTTYLSGTKECGDITGERHSTKNSFKDLMRSQL